jgi:multimeric flavodoxin WrbA
MTVIGINGSPRKNWNTATLLKKALEGAASAGAETDLVHLYELDFKGCMSCFACKLIDGPSNGRCAWKDELSPVLARIEKEAEAIILASPVYFGSMSGEMRSFLERLLFAPLVYTKPPKSRSAFPRRIRSGVIYTMNLSEAMSVERGYDRMFSATEASLRMIFGSAETFCCYDTLQFADYSKVVMEMMDPEEKVRRHREVFPEDCIRAFEFGRRLAAGN